MSIETKTLTIDDVEYQFNTWPADKGLSYGVRILALGGDALGAFIQGQANVRFQEKRDSEGNLVLFENEDGNMLPEMEVVKDNDNQFIQKATSLLVAKLDNKEVVSLIKEILSTVKRVGESQPINFGQDLAGKYDVMAKLVVGVIKENNLQGFLAASVTGLI
jgi:hypothetical protein